MVDISDDEFEEQVRTFFKSILEATGMRPGYEAPKGSREGVARITAAIAVAMYGEWLVNSAPGKLAEKTALLSDARKLARKICLELSSRIPDGPKAG
ncbi:MAG TPA: hypothetical protein VIJ22_19705 [Polyangiaceae bacterium]